MPIKKRRALNSRKFLISFVLKNKKEKKMKAVEKRKKYSGVLNSLYSCSYRREMRNVVFRQKHFIQYFIVGCWPTTQLPTGI